MVIMKYVQEVITEQKKFCMCSKKGYKYLLFLLSFFPRSRAEFTKIFSSFFKELILFICISMYNPWHHHVTANTCSILYIKLGAKSLRELQQRIKKVKKSGEKLVREKEGGKRERGKRKCFQYKIKLT